MANRTTYKNLVEEVLNELLFQRSRGQQSVEISPEELSHEVSAMVARWPGEC